MRKIKIFIRAHIFDYPYWRVTYMDGRETIALPKDEAHGLCLIFGGKAWIDYTITKFDSL